MVWENSIMVLKMCLHDDKLAKFSSIQLAFGIAIYSLKTVF